MSEDNRRRFTRISIGVELRVLDGGASIPAKGLRNISLGGAYVLTDQPQPEGTICRVKISLVGPSSLLEIEVDAEVVRAEEDGMALNFSKIDVDSLVHLRHLIKLHSLDPETVDKEFSQILLGID
jgi:hypothetical protein